MVEEFTASGKERDERETTRAELEALVRRAAALESQSIVLHGICYGLFAIPVIGILSVFVLLEAPPISQFLIASAFGLASGAVVSTLVAAMRRSDWRARRPGTLQRMRADFIERQLVSAELLKAAPEGGNRVVSLLHRPLFPSRQQVSPQQRRIYDFAREYVNQCEWQRDYRDSLELERALALGLAAERLLELMGQASKTVDSADDSGQGSPRFGGWRLPEAAVLRWHSQEAAQVLERADRGLPQFLAVLTAMESAVLAHYFPAYGNQIFLCGSAAGFLCAILWSKLLRKADAFWRRDLAWQLHSDIFKDGMLDNFLAAQRGGNELSPDMLRQFTEHFVASRCEALSFGRRGYRFSKGAAHYTNMRKLRAQVLITCAEGLMELSGSSGAERIEEQEGR